MAAIGTSDEGRQEMAVVSPGVYMPGDARTVRLSRAEVDALRAALPDTPKGRSRFCAHRDPGERVHEMIIVLDRYGYVRPHRHVGRVESLHVLEGRADAVFFDDEGGVVEVISLGEYASGQPFYYRIDTPLLHTLLVHSDTLVYHEVTEGPFAPGQGSFAPWSPAEDQPAKIDAFLAALRQQARGYRVGRGAFPTQFKPPDCP